MPVPVPEDDRQPLPPQSRFDQWLAAPIVRQVAWLVLYAALMAFAFELPTGQWSLAGHVVLVAVGAGAAWLLLPVAMFVFGYLHGFALYLLMFGVTASAMVVQRLTVEDTSRQTALFVGFILGLITRFLVGLRNTPSEPITSGDIETVKTTAGPQLITASRQSVLTALALFALAQYAALFRILRFPGHGGLAASIWFWLVFAGTPLLGFLLRSLLWPWLAVFVAVAGVGAAAIWPGSPPGMLVFNSGNPYFDVTLDWGQ